MASWMVHLRIADKLLDRIPGLAPVPFIMGNIAPDSGVPNEDWTKFTPSTAVSHYRRDTGEKAGKIIDLDAYLQEYFTPEHRKGYDKEQFGFYLGYFTHLLTDQLWSKQVAKPSFRHFIGQTYSAKDPMVALIKEDWYDLDRKYLRDHPGFRAFRVYLGSVGFVNTYMTQFSRDAFENRRQYITEFYLEEKQGLDRVYPYLTEEKMDAFVETATEQILTTLHSFLPEQ